MNLSVFGSGYVSLTQAAAALSGLPASVKAPELRRRLANRRLRP